MDTQSFKTYSATPDDIERDWHVVDATNLPVGRLASRIAHVLRGKHKPMYTPHVDTGDHVIVVNCDDLVLTGRKMDGKTYHSYSGYHSGHRELTARQRVETDSASVVHDAVRGMLPKNRLGKQMLTKLKVYAGSEHPHAAQRPEELPVRGND
jgi:large subunit ribosomal protein L13